MELEIRKFVTYSEEVHIEGFKKKYFTPTQKTIEEFSNWISKSLKDL
tara:strand:+ start:1136 stop:1276 length:141 start_codon:yes stop_codon:yes gene_type:complete